MNRFGVLYGARVVGLELVLTWDQMRPQLHNFKKVTYGNSQATLLLNTKQLEEKMGLSMSMETAKLSTLTVWWVYVDNNSSERHYYNLQRY